jgi:HD-GYP domain-containing protein (c-di-GMP phosphodiesterase class II)
MGGEIEGYIRSVERLNEGIIRTLAQTIDAISPWTLGHSERGAELSLKIGRVMGLGEKELKDLHHGAYLHDIGKIYDRDFHFMADKKSRLTEEEMKVMRAHPANGKRLLEHIKDYAEGVIPVVAQHHEWFDGGGYPEGLSGEEISLGARILAVADVYDALTSDRPYRKGMVRGKAIFYIREKTGEQFDPKVVDAFLKVMAEEEKKEPVRQLVS